MSKITSKETQDKELTEAREALALSDEPKERKVDRRRTEDEINRAINLLASGHPRPKDDDSPQVLMDLKQEVFALRELVMSLTQDAGTMYQRSVARIRELTSR